MMKAIPLINCLDHFFFGFHDLIVSNKTGEKILALRSKDITTTPNGIQTVEVGFFKDSHFNSVGTTLAFNYPQGARIQWINDTDFFSVNDRHENKWVAKIYDSNSKSLYKVLNYPIHCVTKNGIAFGLDYARLHRVGGYGYTGIEDSTKDINAPKVSGIVKHNIYTGESELLLSVNQVANYLMDENAGNHHYITHAVLSPNENRIIFLHRYKLKDGGETTRLMTIGINGDNLRCLASGFLSHFDWMDDKQILIWGRINSNVEKLRNSVLYKLIPNSILIKLKKFLKLLIKTKSGIKNPASLFKWLLISDSVNNNITEFDPILMTEDGHPMFCPTNRDWLVCDTYPNADGVRQMYLYKYSSKLRVELGDYKMIDDKPNIDKSLIGLKDVDKSVLKAFSIEKMAFYRSGLHCDLHPRWDREGKFVCFDSIHEGKRNMYIFDVDKIINE